MAALGHHTHPLAYHTHPLARCEALAVGRSPEGEGANIDRRF